MEADVSSAGDHITCAECGQRLPKILKNGGIIHGRIWDAQQNRRTWPIQRDEDVDTGTSFFVFADLSTRVHETARGWDSPWNNPSTTARAILSENDAPQMIYRVYER
jgi:hypothetical protein